MREKLLKAWGRFSMTHPWQVLGFFCGVTFLRVNNLFFCNQKIHYGYELV
jgi:hypothetical protein